MKQERFDALTKTMAGGLSRREALRTLGAGIATAAMAALFPAQAWAEPKEKTIKCKIKENGRDADGNKVSVYCEVNCTGDAGYCVVCGNKDKSEEGDSLSCAAACCASDDPTMCIAPNKKEIQSQCQQGRVRIVKEK